MKQRDQNPRPTLRVAHVGHAIGLGFRRICLLAVVCTHCVVALMLFTDWNATNSRIRRVVGCRSLGQAIKNYESVCISCTLIR